MTAMSCLIFDQISDMLSSRIANTPQPLTLEAADRELRLDREVASGELFGPLGIPARERFDELRVRRFGVDVPRRDPGEETARKVVRELLQDRAKASRSAHAI